MNLLGLTHILVDQTNDRYDIGVTGRVVEGECQGAVGVALLEDKHLVYLGSMIY